MYVCLCLCVCAHVYVSVSVSVCVCMCVGGYMCTCNKPSFVPRLLPDFILQHVEAMRYFREWSGE